MPVRSLLTVTIPAATRQLATTERFMSLVGITDPAQTDNVDFLNTTASTKFEQECNRVFAQQAYSEQIRIWPDPPGRTARRGLDLLQLRAFPVLPPAGPIVLTVTENGVALVQGTDYEIDYDIGQLTRLAATGTVPSTAAAWWPCGLIVVAYTAGYLLPNDQAHTLPSDIEDAVISLMRSRWFARNRDPMQRSHGEPGLGQTTWWVGAIGPGDNGLPPDVNDTIDNYRAPVLA